MALSALYLVTALTYEMGTLARPGPGVYPLFVSFFFLLGSAGTLIAALVRPVPGTFELPAGAARKRVLLVLAACIAYVLLLPIVGYPLATIALILITLHGMGMPSWPTKAGLAIALTTASFVLFDIVLSVPLPMGMWAP